MLRFKQFLLESNRQNLFHGTVIRYALEISYYNIIRGGKVDEGWVSFARNVRAAESYVKRIREVDDNKIVTFELDGNLLRHKYKVEPFNYYAPRNVRLTNLNEYEERIKGEINNLNRYIVKIHISSDTYKYLQSSNGNKENKALLTHPKLYDSKARQFLNK